MALKKKLTYNRKHFDSFVSRSKPYLIKVLPIEIALLLLFMLSDLMWFKGKTLASVLLSRILLALLPALYLFKLARTAGIDTKKLYRWILFNALGLGLSVVLVLFVAHFHAIPLPWEGLIIVLMAIVIGSGLLALEAILVASSVGILYLGLSYFYVGLNAEWMQRSLILVTSLIFSAVVVIWRDRTFHGINIVLQRARRRSLFDSLTGAKNRNALDDDFELCRRISARGEGLIVAIIDIDFFKHINDTYGHPTGDNYLRQLANLYRKHVRRVGDSLIRMGGEEFLMLLANTTMQEGKEHLRRLQQEVEQMNLVNERCQNGSQTISIGAVWVARDILRCNQGSEFFLMLYKNADQLLYTAKSEGRNQLKLAVLQLR